MFPGHCFHQQNRGTRACYQKQEALSLKSDSSQHKSQRPGPGAAAAGLRASHTPTLSLLACRRPGKRRVFYTCVERGNTASGQWCGLRFAVAEVRKIWRKQDLKQGSPPKQLVALEGQICPKAPLSLPFMRSSRDAGACCLLYCTQGILVRLLEHAHAAACKYVSERSWKYRTSSLQNLESKRIFPSEGRNLHWPLLC